MEVQESKISLKQHVQLTIDTENIPNKFVKASLYPFDKQMYIGCHRTSNQQGVEILFIGYIILYNVIALYTKWTNILYINNYIK